MQSPSSAFLSYLDMLRDGIRANKYTFPPLIKAASMLSSNRKGLIGRLVHGHAVKLGVSNDLFVGSALIEFYAAVLDIGSAGKLFDEMAVRDVVLFTAMIDGYGKVGDVGNARKVFDEMPERNAVSWSAIMAAYSRASDFREVLRLFRRMQEDGIRPNESGLVSVLTACGHLGAIVQGLWVHAYARRCKYDSNPILATALVDMYSRCGCVESALSVFELIPGKDVGAWNAVICGAAMNGDARKSLELFEQMISSGIRPNETTFITVLTACTHAKLVSEGLELFEQMSIIHNVEPQLEHYACVVDLLARAGMVEEAEEFIEGTIGGLERADSNVWGALLGACRVYGRVDIGNRVSKKLARMGVKDVGAHVLCYSIYKEAGWEAEAKHARRLVSDSSVRKKPGCSMVEVDGVIEEFLAGNLSHPKALEMCTVLASWSKMLSHP